MFNESDDDLELDEDFNYGTLHGELESYLSQDFLQQVEEGERPNINPPDHPEAFNDTDSRDDFLRGLHFDANDEEIRSFTDVGNELMDDVIDGSTEPIPMNAEVASVPVATEPISDVLQILLNDIRQSSGMNHPNVSDGILIFVLLTTFTPLLSSLDTRPHSNNDLLTDVIYHIERQNPSSRMSKVEAQKAPVQDDKPHKRKDRPCGNILLILFRSLLSKDEVTKIAKNCHRDCELQQTDVSHSIRPPLHCDTVYM